MTTNKRGILLILLAGWMITESCKKNSTEDIQPATTPDPAPAVMSARDSAVNDYNTNYLGSAISTIGWTGNTSICDPGTISSSVHTAIINRINYFRRMAGLNDNCTQDASMYSQEQQAALMMSANNALSHNPPTSWSCYTAAGHTGAAGSNLAMSTTGTDAVTAFINDYGTGNEPCGHRRWLLYSPRTTFSDGSTNTAAAIYVFGAGGNTHIPAYIAYPPKGYVPQQLVFDRWSLSIPNANFSSATVTMTGPGGNIPLSIISTVVGYGDNSIVWVPTGINTSSTSDITYTVTVSGITNASATSYSYNVVVIKP